MSDLRKAAEMALEVLSHSLGHSNEAQEQIDKTKKALRQALTQPEKHLKFEGPIHVECRCDKCKAQPEQVLTARVVITGVDAVNMSQERVDETEKREHECPDWDFLEIDEDDPEFESCLCYTAPPKREWVGLTNADKQEAFDETQEASGGFWEFADYLDAKLKEKNT